MNDNIKTETTDGPPEGAVPAEIGSEEQPAHEMPPESEADNQSTSSPQPYDGWDPKAEFRRLLAEAEERGYKRGVNEQLRKALDQPDLFADLARERAGRPTSTNEDQLSSKFLKTIRPGIWD